MELLVTQLHDHSKAVSIEALDILDEACEDKVKKHLTKALLFLINICNKNVKVKLICSFY